MILTFRPIKVWPVGWQPANAERPPSPFDSTYSATLELLDRELDQLGATEAFLQVDATPGQVRIDGQLKGNAVVDHPGVILTIDTRSHGVLVYDTDRFGRGRAYRGTSGLAAWQQNLRAIALGLEALRKVERYGIGDRGQQYAGYRELGSGIALGATAMTVDEAAHLLADEALGPDPSPAFDRILTDEHAVAVAFRQASKRHHPDLGGDAAKFRRLVEARDLLLEHLR